MNFIKNKIFKYFILAFSICNIKTFKRELVGSLTTFGGLGTAYLANYLYKNKDKYTNSIQEKYGHLKESTIKKFSETKVSLKDKQEETKKYLKDKQEETKKYISKKKNSLSETYNDLKDKASFLLKLPYDQLKSNNARSDLLLNIEVKKKENSITEDQYNFLKSIFENEKFIISNEKIKLIILTFLDNLINIEKKNQNDLYIKFKENILNEYKGKSSKKFIEEVFTDAKSNITKELNIIFPTERALSEPEKEKKENDEKLKKENFNKDIEIEKLKLKLANKENFIQNLNINSLSMDEIKKQ